MKGQETEQQAAEALQACLADVPFLQVGRIQANLQQGGVEADLVIDLKTQDGSPLRIVVEVKTSGQPRLAREAANQLLRLRKVFPDAYRVFMAPYISPQAAEICAEEGVGYLDLAGNCLLAFGQVYIRREGIRNPFVQKRSLRSLYAPKSSRVLRVLMMHTSDWWKTQALADEAGVSLGQVSNVKKQLLDREWIVESDEGFRLTDPEALLQDWSEGYTYRKNTVRDFYAMKDTGEVEISLAEVCRDLGISYAFTGFSGARRVAPTVRGQRAMAYVSAISKELLARVGLKEVPSGANASLMLPYDEGVYYEAKEVDGLKVVCPVQLYLDLKGFKGRGEEAAEAVRKQVLKKLW